MTPNYTADGQTMAREKDSLTPNGNIMNGRWALRDPLGALVDFDRYRNDLAERNHLDVAVKDSPLSPGEPS